VKVIRTLSMLVVTVWLAPILGSTVGTSDGVADTVSAVTGDFVIGASVGLDEGK
jgi:hypothetical protein